MHHCAGRTADRLQEFHEYFIGSFAAQDDCGAEAFVQADGAPKRFPLAGNDPVRDKAKLFQTLFSVSFAGDPYDPSLIAGVCMAEWNNHADHFFHDDITISICIKTGCGNQG